MNSKFPFPWPKTQSLITGVSPGVSPGERAAFDIICKLIAENPNGYVSEKLDGCNFCVSSRHYVASRNVIVARTKSDLKSTFFNKLILDGFIPVLDQVNSLNSMLASELSIDPQNLETLVYGELMLKGTADCVHDIYNYRSRNIKAGKFYAFGIGIVFHDLADPTAENEKVKQLFETYNIKHLVSEKLLTRKQAREQKNKNQGSGESVQTKKGYWVIPLNLKVKILLDQFDIVQVPMKKIQDSLFNIITRKQIGISLKLRKVEGYIINTPNLLLKLKYRDSKDDARDALFNRLTTEFPFNDAVHCLKDIYNSAEEFCGLHSASMILFNDWFAKVAAGFDNKNLDLVFRENVAEVGPKMFSDDTKAVLRIFLKRLLAQILKEHLIRTRIDPRLKYDVKTKLDKKFLHLISETNFRMEREKGKDETGSRLVTFV